MICISLFTLQMKNEGKKNLKTVNITESRQKSKQEVAYILFMLERQERKILMLMDATILELYGTCTIFGHILHTYLLAELCCCRLGQ